MSQPTLFSSGFELAAFVRSSGLLPRSWKVISSAGINSNVGVGLSWKVHKESDPDLTIIAFETTPVSQDQIQAGLVSSDDLKGEKFLHFDFLCTKSNPLFKVNSPAFSLFRANHQKLDQLKSEIKSSIASTQLIVTGHALGGSVASLFVLWLLDIDSIASGKKRPLCITFGSPLIGDKGLQRAISRSSTWNSYFLHVVSDKDPLPRLFITDHTSPVHTSAYMPFGTFLLCSDINSTCSDNPDSILELLKAMGSIHDQNQVDYGNIVEKLKRKAICKDFTTRDMTHSDSLLASITLQLRALGLTPDMQNQQQNIDIDTLVTKMVTREKKIRSKFDPSKKLNNMKIDMARLEWYKKDSKIRDIGYYDSYKNDYSTREWDQDAVLWQRNLTLYWKEKVEEAEMNPQKEDAALRTRWLFAGNTYMRMVEPLEIAQYYKDGGKDYVTEKRPKHYKLLEQWLKEDTTATNDSNSTSRKNVESILTLDSCFWAHVEEALLSCKQLKDVKSSVPEKDEARKKLLEFQEYVYGLLKNYAVSPEVFLVHSSYMTWWNQYKAIEGASYNPKLASFMSNAKNYNELYAGGAFDFS